MIDLLVGHAEQRAAARKLGIHVTDAQVAASEKQLVDGQFHGNRKAFLRYSRQQGMTEGDIRDLLDSNLLQSTIADRLTAKLQVGAAEIRAYYRANEAQYRSHRTRPVRQILVRSQARAEELATQALGGADFAALARRVSVDPAAKRTGGATTLDEGTLSIADRAALFALPVGKVSQPFRIGVVWAIVQPTGPVAPSTTVPLSRVRLQIAQYLLAQKRQNTLASWMNGVKNDCAKGARYAEGYRPTG
jgi:peptidyl-prolyl cis-trans isomerase C